jgi:hypothetical protein
MTRGVPATSERARMFLVLQPWTNACKGDQTEAVAVDISPGVLGNDRSTSDPGRFHLVMAYGSEIPWSQVDGITCPR